VRGCGEESTPTVLACLGLLRVYASNQSQQLKFVPDHHFLSGSLGCRNLVNLRLLRMHHIAVFTSLVTMSYAFGVW